MRAQTREKQLQAASFLYVKCSRKEFIVIPFLHVVRSSLSQPVDRGSVGGEKDLGTPKHLQKVAEKNKCAIFPRKLYNKMFKSIINGSTHPEK